MTSKERVHAALEGKAVDRFPVAALYCQLYHQDHFAELTGRPQWELHRWLYAEPQEHLALYRQMVEQAPFEILQPQHAPSCEARENTEFVQRQGRVYRHDKRTDTYTSLESVSGHPIDYTANETQHVFDIADAETKVKVTRADELIATGVNDYVEAAVAAFGSDHFILSGGVVGTLWACHSYVGLTNLLGMLIEQPDLIDYLCWKGLEQNLEIIRQLAAAGGDAIFIDDAFGTNDVISVAHYERFCLPTMKEMVREIHAVGHKAISIYYGGVADRLEEIASIGADGLLVETSMKGYTNDLSDIASKIGDRVTLFGNIDPIGVLQDGTDEELEAEIKRQVAAGRNARGFVVSPASPITPGTPLTRVRRFIELAQRHGRPG